MSGFELVPVPGGDPIRLPTGETVLGRGPFLGVSDKRVSRHHGLLENLNGRLRLKPTHLNPCFLQLSLSDEPRALQRDSWCPLGHGDLFSLLPGQFLFRVVAVGGDDCTPSHTAPCAGRDHGSPSRQEEPTAAALFNEEANGPSTRLNMEGSTLPKEADDDHSDVPRKRVLPAWMMSASPGLTAQSVNRSKIPAASSSNKRAAAKRALALSEEETRPCKKTRTSWTGAHRSSEGPVRNPSGPVHEVEEAEANTRKQDKEPQTKPEPAESVGSNSGTAPASAPSPNRVRTRCPYGKDCYRKNPVHFQESSHPGDSDYEEQEEEDRPECPYGTDCYRKNPLHWKEYKHPNKAALATRGVTDDDSDYVPPDSDSDHS